MRKRIVGSVVEELEKDVRPEGRHRGTDRQNELQHLKSFVQKGDPNQMPGHERKKGEPADADRPIRSFGER